MRDFISGMNEPNASKIKRKQSKGGVVKSFRSNHVIKEDIR